MVSKVLSEAPSRRKFAVGAKEGGKGVGLVTRVQS